MIRRVKAKDPAMVELEVLRQSVAKFERDQSEHGRLVEDLRLLHVLTRDIVEAAGFQSALDVAVRRIAEMTRWVYGEAWVPYQDGNREVLKLSPQTFWWSGDLKEFRELSEKMVFPPDVGLPGRVWSKKNTEWVRDISVQSEKEFPRCRAALAAGFRAGVGVPIMALDEVMAVLVFFMRESSPRGEELVGLVSTVAAELGLVVRRKRVEDEILNISRFPSENPNPVLRVDGKAKILYQNDAVSSILRNAGLPEENVYKILPDKLEELVTQSLMTKKPIYDLEVKAGDRSYSYAMVPVVERGCVNLYATDITDRLRCENRFQMVVESTPNGIVVVDQEGKMLMVNTGLEKMFGFSRNELMGQAIELLVPDRLHEKYVAYRKNFFSSPHRHALHAGPNFFGRRKDGREFPIEMALSPVERENGTHLLATIVDISIRKKEEALERQAENLKRSNKELEDFAYVASHDLKEPLRKIVTFGNLLEKKDSSTLDGISRDYLNRMRNAAQRMNHLIEDLLEYSRVVIKPRPPKLVELKEVVQGVLSDLEVLIRESGAEFEIGPLPVVRGDSIQMRQLFHNLVSNALKFRKTNEKICVAIHSRTLNEGFYEITIEDNGIGFDTKHLEQIFLPFRRLHSRDEYEGTGIGLSICKRVVERHGGDITVTSEPGKKTVFIVRLPKV